MRRDPAVVAAHRAIRLAARVLAARNWLPREICSDDLQQVALIALWRAEWPQDRGLAYTVAFRAMIDELRRWTGRPTDGDYARNHRVDDVNQDWWSEDRGASPDAMCRVRQAIRVVAGMTDCERSTVERLVAGASQSEIAREDGVTDSAITIRLRRVREKLAVAI